MQRGASFVITLLITGCAGQHSASESASASRQAAARDRAPEDLPATSEASPSDLYGRLFEEVQLSGLFADSKTFADAIARRDPKDIVDRYDVEKQTARFDLKRFVAEEFELPSRPASGFASQNQDVRKHIQALWPVLTRPKDTPGIRSSRLPLPFPYVVPGGRFDEIYYWDSFFTMLGLEADGLHETARGMCRNFMHLVDRYGHVPNGNRTYYLSRSQPPLLFAMMELIARRDGQHVWQEFAPILLKEYEFWMAGSDSIPRRSAHRRVVRLSDGSLLNRYWDDRDTPRDESYREDIETAQKSQRAPAEVYRNLRAAAESGWDFSSRWFVEGAGLETIRIVDLIPVDLNAFLYGVESALAEALTGSERARAFRERAEARRRAILTHLWSEELVAFTDLEWRNERPTRVVTAATVVPLFVGLPEAEQARRVAQTLEQRLLAPHGLLTTLVSSGEQWDAPNGWAPLVWMASAGLRRYGSTALAGEIEQRWIARNQKKYRETGKLVEKYDVLSSTATAGGGEYPLQDGFGWTNGVLSQLLAQATAQ